MARWDSLKLSNDGDPELAATMRRLKVRAPVEKIVDTDYLATALNRESIGPDLCKRVVILDCGHRIVTRNRRRAPCPTCHAMILNGEDYEAFRRRGDM